MTASSWRGRIPVKGVLDIIVCDLPDFVGVGVVELRTSEHAPGQIFRFSVNQFNAESALASGVCRHRVIDRSPVITIIRAVDTPVRGTGVTSLIDHLNTGPAE